MSPSAVKRPIPIGAKLSFEQDCTEQLGGNGGNGGGPSLTGSGGRNGQQTTSLRFERTRDTALDSGHADVGRDLLGPALDFDFSFIDDELAEEDRNVLRLAMPLSQRAGL
jgi:hypothetical protein